MFRLPEELRESLRDPLGPVIQAEDVESTLGDTSLVITVGDMSALTLADLGVHQDVIVVDFHTKRSEEGDFRKRLQEVCDDVLKVSNPPATITSDLWSALDRALEMVTKGGRSVRIEVEGEEDLAVLPAVALAPLGAVVVYGQPNEGLVIAPVDEQLKQKVNEYLNQMKR